MRETYEHIHMEEIYCNVERAKHLPEPPADESNVRKAKRRFPDRGFISLGLLSLFLLVWLVGLAVAYNNLVRHSWDVEVNLTERLTTSEHELSAMAVERDTLHSNLSKQSIELERLRAAARQRRHCPDRWTRFSGNCYLLSTQSLSWKNARQSCIREGADLVTINNDEKQRLVSKWITADTWIGLNDREEEGTWRWSRDDSPLTEAFWSQKQPDNGGKTSAWGEEDCVHLEVNSKKWNDRQCDNSMNFICEKWLNVSPV